MLPYLLGVFAFLVVCALTAWVIATRGALLGTGISRWVSDRLAPHWDAFTERALAPDPAAERQAVFEALGPALEADPAASILDVTCGSGRFLLALCQSPDLAGRYLGLDFSTRMVQHAQAKADELGQAPRLQFSVVRGRPLAFPDGAFDIVVCSEGLEMRRHPLLWLAEMARVVAPGGLLVVSYAVGWRRTIFPARTLAGEDLLAAFEHIRCQLVSDVAWRGELQRLMVARKS